MSGRRARSRGVADQARPRNEAPSVTPRNVIPQWSTAARLVSSRLSVGFFPRFVLVTRAAVIIAAAGI
jgi:hypothetical protein